MSFVHLHLHTTFSFLDGYGTPKQFIDRAKAIGQTAFAVTDHGNVFGHRPFMAAGEKAGVKIIVGCEFYVRNPSGKYFHLTVLAKDNEGYANLCRLVSLSAREDHFDTRPLVTWTDLRKNKKGLIFLSGCFGAGALHKLWIAKRTEEMTSKAAAMKRLLGPDFYLEIQHTDPGERDMIRTIGKMIGVKCVPTLDVHYPRREDYETEDLIFCIGQKKRMGDMSRYRLPETEWMMSEEEVLAQGFTQEECDLTAEIASQCNVKFEKLTPLRIEHDRETMIEMVGKYCKRLGERIKNEIYRDRYRYELSVVDRLGLHSYFVIMADVINEFKSRGVCIGPARGSSAGSLIAYLLGITEIDPIAHQLSFERFLDINRRDYPDIDTDFPPKTRDAVVEYLRERYGRDRVGRIGSFTTWRGGSVFWDIARVYGIDRTIAGRLGKDIPALVNDQIGMKEILNIPSVAAVVKKWPVFAKALDIEGQIRQLGQHASGYAVSPVSLTDLMPDYRMGDSTIISVDKEWGENAGLIKLDILNLETLDIIQEVLEDAKLRPEYLYTMPFNDPNVLREFRNVNVAGVFQFEGHAVKKALRTIAVESFDDLAFINAVARPGASNALTGTVKVPAVLSQFIYKGKYFVYQEELMAILRFLNFDWDEVTKFRKLVSKKKTLELQSLFFDKFVRELSKHIPPKEAIEFWGVVNKCGEYMFNKSHAVAYAALAYYCMHLKLYYGPLFVKAYMNGTDSDEKRREMLRECLRRGWKYRVYDPLIPTTSFSVRENTVVGSLLAVKGVGMAKAAKIMIGKMDRGTQKALANAEALPSVFAPWAALDDFGNRYRIGDLPEGEYVIKARVWAVKDGHCMMEDKYGAERGYFNPDFVTLEEGGVYALAITKFKYAKIDSARPQNT